MGEAKRRERLLADSKAEMERWGERRIVADMDITTLLAMTGALQLALRHPGFSARPSATAVRDLVLQFIEQIPADYPAIRELMRLGFHPRFDVE
ncbi:MAG: hypothetical protein KGL39_27905 [Patescibacteria group bacterium]|nr:hypothetical protein [Patescibacteria group bacterium]